MQNQEPKDLLKVDISKEFSEIGSQYIKKDGKGGSDSQHS
jgi:hypothetical protein